MKKTIFISILLFSLVLYGCGSSKEPTETMSPVLVTTDNPAIITTVATPTTTTSTVSTAPGAASTPATPETTLTTTPTDGNGSPGIIAESGFAGEIQSAANEAYRSGGGVVFIPEGDFVLNGSVTIRDNVEVVGAGIGKTVLRTSGPSMVIKMRGDNTRISSLSLISTDYDGGNGIMIDNCIDFRVDHVHIEGYSSQAAIYIEGIDTRGVIDHSYFKMKPVSDLGYGIVVYRDDYWDDQMELGTEDAVFIEDNTFVNTRHAVAANSGAHYVFRHNVIEQNVYAQAIDAHGPYWGSTEGTRCVEIYDNLIENPEASGSERAMGIRGGGGVIFNNTIIGYTYGIMLIMEDHQDMDSYPVYHQVHDLYIWDNSFSGEAEVIVQNLDHARTFIIQDRDYFLYALPGYIPYTYPHPLTDEPVPQFPAGHIIEKEPVAVPFQDMPASSGIFSRRPAASE